MAPAEGRLPVLRRGGHGGHPRAGRRAPRVRQGVPGRDRPEAGGGRLARDALLLANVHDAVVVTDLDGVVTYWNEGATRLFGWTAEEMVGRPYADRFPEPIRSWVAEEIRERAAGSEWSGEYEDYRKDGSRVWIDARVSPVTDAAGGVVGVLGVSHDITERKRAEEALREADRRKDEFIALLAHELRNPLAPIRNGLQVMRLVGATAAARRAVAGDDGPAARAHGAADRRPARRLPDQPQQDGAAAGAGAARGRGRAARWRRPARRSRRRGTS